MLRQLDNKANVAGAEWLKRRAAEDKTREITEGPVIQGSGRPAKDSGL